MKFQEVFLHNGKKHVVSLSEDGLTWSRQGDFNKVLSHEIVSCWICPSGSVLCAPGISSNIKGCHHIKKAQNGLSLEIARRKQHGKWALSIFVFIHSLKDVVLSWHHAIWNKIHRLEERPHKLLVVINPIGGRKKAAYIFKETIAPIFNRAWIETLELQTKFKGHGIQLVQEAAASLNLMTKFDGLIAVGGDGLVSEMVTGLFLHTCLQEGINPHDFDADLPFAQLRLGIIPSGSTDATCFATHGSNDIVTAALHVIMGDRKSVDVAAVHYDGQLKRVATSLISYGYFGDLMRSSECWRCLGPHRYMLAGIQQLFRNRSYPVRVLVRKKKDISVNRLSSTTSCSSICSVCDFGSSLPHPSSEFEWEEISGNFSVASAAVTSCACRLTPQGVSPLAHLGDGFSDLILVDGSSRTKLLSYLYHTSITGTAVNLPHVRIVRTNEIHFSTSSECHSLFNCDGEEMHPFALSIKIHRQKLSMFCRGVENPLQLAAVYKTNQLESIVSKLSLTTSL